jgi:imidazoleglycerol-phosphate dehydratase
MSDPSSSVPPPSSLPGEKLDGAWIGPEGWEADDTVRPTRLTPEQLAQIRRSSGEETPGASLTSERKTRPRTARVQRETGETKISLTVELDGTGKSNVATGIGFFDHMLTLLAKHSLIDLTIEARGDLHVDAHHTVEDVGICLGKALAEALGDKSGIRRYGSATLPMDEALVTAAVDLSGRPFVVWKVDLPPELLGTFNAPLAEEFWRAVAAAGLFNLHVICHHGRNSHHIVEAVFKAAARALRQAIESDPRMTGVPSTKGVL